jgi:hypothetical protein
LLGDSKESRLRHGWRDVEDPDVAWALLLAEAIRQVDLVAFDEDERRRRISAVYHRQLRRWRR